MGILMKLGGREEEKRGDSSRYTEGYNAGYNNALEEMRRRRSPRGMYEDTENRRRGARSEEDRQIGFTGDRARQNPSVEDMLPGLMDMAHELKKGQERIMEHMGSVTEKLDPRLADVLESATHIMDNPPSTWEPYKHRGDYAGILKMEGKELLEALEARKPLKDIRKELTHTLAALFQIMEED